MPRNDTLVADTWDRVADRLFKIRHCLDIAGNAQQLPLFEPPIEPGLLVRAAAAGIDLASALRDIEAPQPIHRYAVLSQRALELCGEVRGLGQQMLAALEKRDAEALALLRADHEVALLGAMRQVRQQQVDEANRTLDGLRSSRQAADARAQYYRSREFMSPGEVAHVNLTNAAGLFDTAAADASALATVSAAVPQGQAGVAGVGGSPFATTEYGGTELSNALRATSEGLQLFARLTDRSAGLAERDRGLPAPHGRLDDAG